VPFVAVVGILPVVTVVLVAGVWLKISVVLLNFSKKYSFKSKNNPTWHTKMIPRSIYFLFSIYLDNSLQ
jgi:hypothetical protein